MLFILLTTILTLIIIYTINRILSLFTYWKIRQVPYRSPWLFFEMLGQMLIGKKSVAEITIDIYNEFPNEKYNGYYQGTRPMLLLRDPDLIKQICIKDFDHFLDHIGFVDTTTEPLLGRNLFSLKGQEWKDMRTAISPVFTSKKIKSMFILMQECADNFIKYFLDKNQDIVQVELKTTVNRFTNDVIATTAFGIRCDSLKNPDNEFFLMGKTMTNFSMWQNVKMLLYQAFPSLKKIITLKIFDDKQMNYFKSIILDTIKEREVKNIVRPDLINIFVEIRKSQNKQSDLNESNGNQKESKKFLTDIDMVAQAVIFFFAGFESVSVVLSFIAYELAIHPEIQKKLQDEIDLINDDDLTYDRLVGMKYLDQVISETMRLWTPGFQSDRICVKDYTINDQDKSLLIEKGTAVIIPVFGIHRDPKYYPDPMKFDPERFSDENKTNLNPNAFMPFGLGPRLCIASRFALIELKVLIVNILAHFSIVPIKKTHIPLVLSTSSFNLKSKHDFWLGLKRRIK